VECLITSVKDTMISNNTFLNTYKLSTFADDVSEYVSFISEKKFLENDMRKVANIITKKSYRHKFS